MRVCLISIEFFGDGIYGGFGRATRCIGRELARRGVEVSVVVPRRTPDRPATYELDGMTVRQFRPGRPREALQIFRACDADIYHSQDASWGTFLAQRACPRSRHLVTLRDPMDSADWKVETAFASGTFLGWKLYRYFIDNPLVAAAVRRADRIYCAARFLIPKVSRKYRLRSLPEFLPTPIAVPEKIRKADRPTVCFVGRWDGRKRPELFLQLARERPDVQFIAVGAARDPLRDAALRNEFRDLPNLQMPGAIDQFQSNEVGATLEASWVLVNTSPREGLPTTFLEAAAHGCAILSFADPDGFATAFGRPVGEGGLRQGLDDLLAGDRWRLLGAAGRAFVAETFATDAAVSAHLTAYLDALSAPRQ